MGTGNEHGSKFFNQYPNYPDGYRESIGCSSLHSENLRMSLNIYCESKKWQKRNEMKKMFIWLNHILEAYK